MGAVLLLFGMWDWFIPRARYVGSTPEPGATLATVPSVVSIDFSENLDRTSTASVASTITLSSAGEAIYGDGRRFTVTGPSLEHCRRNLRIPLDPDLPRGLYWVQWNAVAASSNAHRSGRFCFGVGMNVPDDIVRDMPGAMIERDAGFRQHRAVVLGGLLLAGLGLLLPRVRLTK